MNTKYKFFSHQAIELGNVIRNHRDSLHLLPGSRQAFIDYQIKKGLLPSGWLSEKELMNIELGHKLPGLITLRYLSIALEISFEQLCSEIEPFIPECSKKQK